MTVHVTVREEQEPGKGLKSDGRKRRRRLSALDLKNTRENKGREKRKLGKKGRM